MENKRPILITIFAFLYFLSTIIAVIGLMYMLFFYGLNEGTSFRFLALGAIALINYAIGWGLYVGNETARYFFLFFNILSIILGVLKIVNGKEVVISVVYIIISLFLSFYLINNKKVKLFFSSNKKHLGII